MRSIVPLAGPDFILPDGRVKAEQSIDGFPLLRAALGTRPWANSLSSNAYSFILLDRPETRRFAFENIKTWYPESHIVFVSRTTRGAALSALAGLTGYTSTDDVVIVDLADILYFSALDVAGVFQGDANAGALALTFESDDLSYSYLETDCSGRFVKAAEKRKISNIASAGTYIFRNTSVYLRALSYSLENEGEQTFNGLHYVCPLLNGVRDHGKNVLLSSVTNVRDIKCGSGA